MFHPLPSRPIAKYVLVGPYDECRGCTAFVSDDAAFRRLRLSDGWRWRQRKLDPWELRQSGGPKVAAHATVHDFALVDARG